MNIVNTIIFVAIIMLGIAISVSKHIYPNNNGGHYPRWIYKLPSPLLGIASSFLFIFGLGIIWVSIHGQGLLGLGFFTKTFLVWLPLIGVSTGILIAVFGISLFGVILLKKPPEIKT
jgi:hypothetical protein